MRGDLARLLLERFRWMDDQLRQSLVDHGFPEITHAQSLVMGTVDRDGTRTSELARRLGITRQAAHQLVRELEKADYVTQQPDPTNASAKLVVLTERGWDSVAVAHRAFARIERTITDRVGEHDAAAMYRALSVDWSLDEPRDEDEVDDHDDVTAGPRP